MAAIRNDLSAHYVRSILDYDPATGIFMWRSRNDVGKGWNIRFAGSRAGRIEKKGYRGIGINRIRYRSNRLAWLWMTGSWPEHQIDHRNRNHADDRWDNLRPATNAQNKRNAKVRKDSETGLKGVCRHGCGWRARIQTDGKRRVLGYFSTKEEARAAYRRAAAREHGEFACFGEH